MFALIVSMCCLQYKASTQSQLELSPNCQHCILFLQIPFYYTAFFVYDKVSVYCFPKYCPKFFQKSILRSFENLAPGVLVDRWRRSPIRTWCLAAFPLKTASTHPSWPRWRSVSATPSPCTRFQPHNGASLFVSVTEQENRANAHGTHESL